MFADAAFYLPLSLALNIILIVFLFQQKRLRAKLLLSALKQTACFADTILHVRKAIQKDKKIEQLINIEELKCHQNSLCKNQDNDFFSEPIEELEQFVHSLLRVVDERGTKLKVPWNRI